PHLADEHLDCRGLAGAVAAQERVDGPLGDAQVEAVDDAASAVGLGEPPRTDRVRHRRTALSSPPVAGPPEALDLPRHQPQHLVRRVAQVDRLRQERVEQLAEAAVARGPGQVGPRPGDEQAQAGPAGEGAVALQLGVGPGVSVGVDRHLARQLADRRQALVRPELAAGDGLANLPDQLLVDRHAAGGVDVEPHAAPTNCTTTCNTVGTGCQGESAHFSRPDAPDPGSTIAPVVGSPGRGSPRRPSAAWGRPSPTLLTGPAPARRSAPTLPRCARPAGRRPTAALARRAPVSVRPAASPRAWPPSTLSPAPGGSRRRAGPAPPGRARAPRTRRRRAARSASRSRPLPGPPASAGAARA